MINQSEKAPIQENESRKMDMEEYYANMRTTVMRCVYEMMGIEEGKIDEEMKKSLEQYGALLTNSIFASIGAGSYFEELIPSSLHKPEKEYSHIDQMPSIVAFENERLKLGNKLNKVQEFRDFSRGFSSEVYEEKRDGYMLQESYHRNLKDNGKITIEELLHNQLGEEDNYISSQLIISDWNSGLKLDIEQLLPNENILAPSDMCNIKEEYDSEKNILLNRIYPVDLKIYSGVSGSNGNFYYNLNLKTVYYGDLTKKGNILALFHEIAHSWQQAYIGKHERGDFGKLHLDVVVLLGLLEDNMTELKNGELSEERSEKYVQFVRKQLGDRGISFDRDNFIYDSNRVKAGDIVFNRYDGKKYVAQCDKFGEVLKGYEKCERDAWAHAILMLRFLKKRNIDLEPELQKSSDFMSVIDPALKSYQKAEERKVEIVGGKICFSRRNGEGE
ncbi:MAG: hypothetical protein WAV73_01405 [Candidatus Moraniibacteriota bacterium]